MTKLVNSDTQQYSVSDDICEHCQKPLDQRDSVQYKNHKYHEGCKKCFVCSETDLRHGETFNGVLFCASCAHRIWQSCAKVRKPRFDNKDDTPSRRAISRRHQRRRPERSPCENGIIALARLAASSYSDDSLDKGQKNRGRHRDKIVKASQLQPGRAREVLNYAAYELKKDSIERGVTTVVTQELLKQVDCPIPNTAIAMDCLHQMETSIHRGKGYNEDYKMLKSNWSDLRIAELGASTEIATMGLRKKSEIPIITQEHTSNEESSGTGSSGSLSSCKEIADNRSRTTSKHKLPYQRIINNTPRRHVCTNEDSLTYVKHYDDNVSIAYQDGHFLSLFKVPFQLFKRKIIDRSSYISLASKQNAYDSYVKKMFKRLCHDDIIAHQRRGMKRLFPTINKRQSPLRLGLSVMDIGDSKKSTTKPPLKRCKHFDRSHSYRCMRQLVMTKAGPTSSELAVIRKKIADFILPKFIRRYLSMYDKHVTHMPFQGCRRLPRPVTRNNESMNQNSTLILGKDIKRTHSCIDPHDPRLVYKELTSATFVDGASTLKHRSKKEKRQKKHIQQRDFAIDLVNRKPSIKPHKASSPIADFSNHNHHIGRLTASRYYVS